MTDKHNRTWQEIRAEQNFTPEQEAEIDAGAAEMIRASREQAIRDRLKARHEAEAPLYKRLAD